MSDIDYVIDTPGRGKGTQLCHINMLKKFHQREDDGKARVVATTVSVQSDLVDNEELQKHTLDMENDIDYSAKLQNSQELGNLDSKLSHLSPEQSGELKS